MQYILFLRRLIIGKVFNLLAMGFIEKGGPNREAFKGGTNQYFDQQKKKNLYVLIYYNIVSIHGTSALSLIIIYISDPN